MSTPFGILAVPASGMNVMQTWINAISDNVANADNVTNPDDPNFFHQSYVVGSAIPGADGGIGQGVALSGIEKSSGQGTLVFDPNNPAADANGTVRHSDVDVTEQMTSLIIAQRAYSANVNVFEQARDAYKQALEIGK